MGDVAAVLFAQSDHAPSHGTVDCLLTEDFGEFRHRLLDYGKGEVLTEGGNEAAQFVGEMMDHYFVGQTLR